MNKFIKGQNVKCVSKVDEEDLITIGNTYTVSHYALSSESSIKAIYIIDDEGDIDWYPEYCFI